MDIDFQTHEINLNEFEKKVLSEENIFLREAYLSKIQESFSLLELMRSSFNQSMDTFLDKSIEAYGAPQKNIFSHILKQLENSIALHVGEKTDTYSELKKKFIWDLSSTIPPYKGHKKNPKTEIKKPEEIRQIFEDSLVASGYTGWTAELIDSPTIRTNFTRKKVFIPDQRSLPNNEVEGLVAHEINTHIKRKVNHRSLLLLYTNFEHISALKRQLPFLMAMAKNRALSTAAGITKPSL